MRRIARISTFDPRDALGSDFRAIVTFSLLFAASKLVLCARWLADGPECHGFFRFHSAMVASAEMTR